MPEVPRFGWRTLLVSTALATIAALMVVVVLSGDDDPPKDRPSTIPTLRLDPEGPTTTVAADAATFTEFDGTVVALASLRGTPTLLNFFASDCVPCITEMPDLEEVHQQLGDRVRFVGLAMQDRASDAEELVRRTGVTYRTAQDRDGTIFQLFGGKALPTTVLLDADGGVVVARAGQVDADDVRALIAQHLGIAP